jgi:pentose-5-phosphate-3-epimerase
MMIALRTECMQTPGQTFYSNKAVRPFTREDILKGRVIKINPALITITDGLVNTVPPVSLQQQVIERVHRLLTHKIRTFHVDVNFEDYSGFGASGPDLNRTIFTPAFLRTLNHSVQAKGAYLNLHLLTDFPLEHLAEYAAVGARAVCFQLDSVSDGKVLTELIAKIQRLGACASPVIETVGTENLQPRSREAVLKFLEHVLAQIGMLTFQVAGTASRSHALAGHFANEQAQSYISFMKQAFRGTIQLQGGMTTHTIADAVQVGADFIVCGSEIFRNREGRSMETVIDDLLLKAADALDEQVET